MTHLEGSVSHGTMNPEHLIPAFVSVLVDEFNDTELPSALSRHWPQVYAVLYDDGDWDDVDNTEEDLCLSELFDRLDTHSPEHFYFGSHPGDGSDYGFWRMEN